MSQEERDEVINLLVVMTGRGEKYYSKMTDDDIWKEYDRLMEPFYD